MNLKTCRSAQYKIKRINFLIYLHIAPGNFSLRAKKSCRKRNLLVRSPLEIFTLKIKFIICNVQKLANAQTFELKAHLINFIFNSLRYRENL